MKLKSPVEFGERLWNLSSLGGNEDNYLDDVECSNKNKYFLLKLTCLSSMEGGAYFENLDWNREELFLKGISDFWPTVWKIFQEKKGGTCRQDYELEKCASK